MHRPRSLRASRRSNAKFRRKVNIKGTCSNQPRYDEITGVFRTVFTDPEGMDRQPLKGRAEIGDVTLTLKFSGKFGTLMDLPNGEDLGDAASANRLRGETEVPANCGRGNERLMVGCIAVARVSDPRLSICLSLRGAQRRGNPGVIFRKVLAANGIFPRGRSGKCGSG